MDLGLLIARLILGLGIAAHGAQKLFGTFGGRGLSSTELIMEGLGYSPGRMFALFAGLGEFGGGSLIALGLLGPVGPTLVIIVMVVAMGTVHIRNGFFAATQGIELPLLYATGALVLAVTGPGRISLDSVLGFDRATNPTLVWETIGVGLLMACSVLTIRRPRHESIPGLFTIPGSAAGRHS